MCDALNAFNDTWQLYQWIQIVCFSLFLIQIAFHVLFYPLITYIKFTIPRFLSSTFWNLNIFHCKQPCYRSRLILGRPSPPFSVTKQNASFPMSPFTLSAVNIDHDVCHPTIQTSCKQLRFTRMNCRLQRCHTQRFQIRNRFWRLLLFPLILLQVSPTVHALPGTNYSMIKGVHTNDTSRQLRYAKTILQQTTSSTSLPSTPSPSPPEPPPSTIRNEPICFVVDTDSITYAVDTGANRFILNDFCSMTNIA